MRLLEEGLESRHLLLELGDVVAPVADGVPPLGSVQRQQAPSERVCLRREGDILPVGEALLPLISGKLIQNGSLELPGDDKRDELLRIDAKISEEPLHASLAADHIGIRVYEAKWR